MRGLLHGGVAYRPLTPQFVPRPTITTQHHDWAVKIPLPFFIPNWADESDIYHAHV